MHKEVCLRDVTRFSDGNKIPASVTASNLIHAFHGWLPLHAAAALALPVETLRIVIGANPAAASTPDPDGMLALMLALVYVLLTRVLCRVSSDPLEGGAEALRGELEVLGAWSQAERRVAWVFGATALLWVARRALVTHLGVPLNDTKIAMAAGLALFVLPSGAEREGALLAWTDTARLP